MAINYYDEETATFVDGSGQWNYSSGQANWKDDDLRFTNLGLGNLGQTATWTITLASAGVYKVHYSWVGNALYATDCPVTVKDNTTTVHSGTLDFSSTPSDLSEEDASWKYLGQFTFASTTLEFKITDAVTGDKYIVADCVRVEGPISGAAPVFMHHYREMGIS